MFPPTDSRQKYVRLLACGIQTTARNRMVLTDWKTRTMPVRSICLLQITFSSEVAALRFFRGKVASTQGCPCRSKDYCTKQRKSTFTLCRSGNLLTIIGDDDRPRSPENCRSSLTKPAPVVKVKMPVVGSLSMCARRCICVRLIENEVCGQHWICGKVRCHCTK